MSGQSPEPRAVAEHGTTIEVEHSLPAGDEKCGYIVGVESLVAVGAVLGTAVLWMGFVFVMLSSLGRSQRNAQRAARRDAERSLSSRASRRIWQKHKQHLGGGGSKDTNPGTAKPS